MAIYFLSDFHFGADWRKDEGKRIRLFTEFLDRIKTDAEYLYILGDLFDFWFEYRNGFPNKYPEITGKLAEYSESGIKVVLVGGNHDWWAGKTFVSLTGAEVFKGDTEVIHHGKRIYLGHGDGRAKTDWQYRILRRILRNSFTIFLFRQLPYFIGIQLARLVSSGSHYANEHRQWKFLDEYEDSAKPILKQGFDAVLLGHTHIPQWVQLPEGLYINTGDWIKHFTFVKLDDEGFSMRTFKNGNIEKFDPLLITHPINPTK